jgi:hypothetical protein
VRALLVLLVVLLQACDETGTGAVVGQLPSTFRVVGSADSTFADGSSVRCQFAFSVTLEGEQERTTRFVRYGVEHGGSAGRTVLDSSGAGFSFVADVHWPQGIARYFPPDSVELLIGDTTNHESRFWHRLAFLTGDVAHGGSGTWTCAPFDIDQGALVDTSGIVLGTWSLEAE